MLRAETTAPPTFRSAAARGASFSPFFLVIAGFLIPDVISVNIGSLRLPITRLIIILLMIPALAAFMKRQGGRLYAFDVCYIAFCFWFILCLMINYGIVGSIQRTGVYFLEYLVLYFIIQGTLRDIATLQTAVNLLIWLVMLLGVLAVIEMAASRPIFMDAAYKLMGLGGYTVDPFMNGGNYYRWGVMRAMTTFSHPILYGVFCAAYLSFAWYTTRSPAMRILKSLGVLIAAALSLSGGPMMMLAVQIAIISVETATRRIPRRASLIFGGIALLLLTVHFVAKSGVYRLVQIFTFSGGSAYYRTLIWDNGIDDVLRNPIFGFRPEEWTRLDWMPISVDNHWLMMLMYTGFPGAGFLTLSILLIARRLFEKPDSALPPELVALRRAWVGAMTATVLAGATVFLFDKAQPAFVILIGLGAAIYRLIRDAEVAGGAPAGAEEAARPGDRRRRPARTVL